jgi:hypothetical protein
MVMHGKGKCSICGLEKGIVAKFLTAVRYFIANNV